MELTIAIHGKAFFYRVRNERNSYIVILDKIIDSVYKYAGDDFGIFLENEIEKEIKENAEDETYNPFPTLETFKKLGEELIYSCGNLFPARYQFEGLRDFVNYLRQFPLEIVNVNRYNQYTLEGENFYRIIYVNEFKYQCYNLIGDIQAEIKDDDLYNELYTIDINQDETIVLNEINQTLSRHGYKLTEMIPH